MGLEKSEMNYTIELVPTVAGKRYYIRCQGKLMRSGFASRATAAERVKVLQAFDALHRAKEEARQLQIYRQLGNQRSEVA